MERERRSQTEFSNALSRRSLLKGMGLTLAAWGLEGSVPSTGWGSRLGHYSQAASAVLAAPARRKYALLIGIDQYSSEARCPSLRGCVNDLELQRNLLIHRFGFQPDDILTLKNKQATRSGVRSAFIEHLLGQVTAEDVAFFHFSGYGSQVQTEEGAELQRTLVLHDSCSGSALIKDLPESTLLLLLRALPTERLLSVLDTGYRIPEDSPLSVGVNLRARPAPSPASFDSQTLELQTALQEQIKARGILPSPSKSAGIILQTTDWIDAALEFEGQAGFVGLMTYALAQQLWRSSGEANWREIMAQASEQLVDELYSLQTVRLLEGRVQGRSLSKSGLVPQGDAQTSGVILSARNANDIDVWLGGLPSMALSYSEAGSLFEVLPSAGAGASRPVASIQIYQRAGLRADARHLRTDAGASLAAGALVGALVREQVRAVPRGIELAIAIDQRLDRIERVDATSALTSIPNLSVVPLQNQPADYIFGRVEPDSPTLLAKLPTPFGSAAGLSDVSIESEVLGSQYGLLTLGREVLPATVGASDEAIKTAVQRLQPHLETLRAAKNIEILENSLTTRLTPQSCWEVLPAAGGSAGASDSVASARASRVQTTTAQVTTVQTTTLTLTAGDRLRYVLESDRNRPLYCLILSFDPLGQWRPVAPTNLTTPLSPGKAKNGVVTLSKRAGLSDLYMLFSIAPFQKTYQLLSAGNQRSPAAMADQPVEQPYQLSEAILHDLDQASHALTPEIEPSDSLYRLNLAAWAGFRQRCRVQPAMAS